MKFLYIGSDRTSMGDRLWVNKTISICNQLPRSTQPGHPSVVWCSEPKQKLGVNRHLVLSGSLEVCVVRQFGGV